MKNIEFERLQSNLIHLEKQFDDLDINEFEERLLNIQYEVIAFKEMCLFTEVSLFEKLLKRIKNIKKENNFYEEQTEKDRMFPNLNETLFNDDLLLENEFEDDF